MGFDRQSLSLTGLYVLSHVYGILAGVLLRDTVVAEGSAVINQEPASGLYLLLILMVATGIMLLLYFFNLEAVVRVWFMSAILLTMLIFFSTFLPVSIALGATVAAFMIRQFTPDLWMRNVMDTFSYAGAGALFGTMIGAVPALIFLGALALYDFLSVFLTGHMVSLARHGVETETFMGLMYPKERSDRPVNTEDVDHLNTDHQEGDAGVQIGILGGGDIIAPMMFSISLLSQYGWQATVLSSAGSVVGLLALMKKTREDEGSYPGIPAIGGGAVAGLLLYLLLALFF